jgi:hypothetical protein
MQFFSDTKFLLKWLGASSEVLTVVLIYEYETQHTVHWYIATDVSEYLVPSIFSSFQEETWKSLLIAFACQGTRDWVVRPFHLHNYRRNTLLDTRQTQPTRNKMTINSDPRGKCAYKMCISHTNYTVPTCAPRVCVSTIRAYVMRINRASLVGVHQPCAPRVCVSTIRV